MMVHKFRLVLSVHSGGDHHQR